MSEIIKVIDDIMSSNIYDLKTQGTYFLDKYDNFELSSDLLSYSLINKIKTDYNNIQDNIFNLKSKLTELWENEEAIETSFVSKVGEITEYDFEDSLLSLTVAENYTNQFNLNYVSSGSDYNPSVVSYLTVPKKEITLSSVAEDIASVYGSIYSTGTVAVTSVASGILKLGENLCDGLIYGTGKVVSFFTKDKDKKAEVEEKFAKTIAYDAVGNLNKAFYENTALGQKINDKSLIKYDSDAAKKIQNVSTTAAEYALVTGVSAVTGGAATPLVLAAVGLTTGVGESAEKQYQNVKDGDYAACDKKILIDGAVNAIDYMVKKDTAEGAINLAKTIESTGGINAVKQIASDLVSFDTTALGVKLQTEGTQILKKSVLNTSNLTTAVSTIGSEMSNIYKNGSFQWDEFNVSKVAVSMSSKILIKTFNTAATDVIQLNASDGLGDVEKFVYNQTIGKEISKESGSTISGIFSSNESIEILDDFDYYDDIEDAA